METFRLSEHLWDWQSRVVFVSYGSPTYFSFMKCRNVFDAQELRERDPPDAAVDNPCLCDPALLYPALRPPPPIVARLHWRFTSLQYIPFILLSSTAVPQMLDLDGFMLYFKEFRRRRRPKPNVIAGKSGVVWYSRDRIMHPLGEYTDIKICLLFTH